LAKIEASAHPGQHPGHNHVKTFMKKVIWQFKHFGEHNIYVNRLQEWGDLSPESKDRHSIL